MVWPYLPLSEAFEHAAACAVDAATSVMQATAAANVALLNLFLQNMPLPNNVFIFLSPASLIFCARRPQSSRSRGRLPETGED